MDRQTYSMSTHARLDSSPLRYGIIPPKWVQLRNLKHHESGTNNQKPREIRAGNQHFFADCHDKETEEFLFHGCFVIGRARRSEYYDNIITVLSVDGDRSERALSEVLRDMRENARITPEYIRDQIHPAFKKGNLSSVDLLMDFLVEKGVSDRLKDKDEYIKSLEQESDLKTAKILELDRIIEEKEQEILKAEKQKPEFNPSDRVELSPVMTLKAVEAGERKNARGQLVKCTYLYFEEPDAPVRIMDGWADKSGEITERARGLIGKPVRTSSWKPEIFNPLNWWRDIYSV